MARIRAIKPEFWLDEEIASWPHVTRLAYIGLWNEADDEGRLRANPAYLKNRLFPYEPKLDIETVLRPIVAAEKLVIYTVGAQTYGFLPKFTDHQVINHPSASKLPALTDGSRRVPGELPDDSRNDPAGKEGKGTGNREWNGRRRREPPPVETTWLDYVRKTYPDWPIPDALSAHGWYESKAWDGVKDWRACAKTCYYRWAGKPTPRNGRSAPTLIGAHKQDAGLREVDESAPEEIRRTNERARRRELNYDDPADAKAAAALDAWQRGAH